MKVLRKLKKHIYWIFSFILFTIFVYLVYGFTKDLSFWRDDYALIYRIQQGGYFAWPYQGWSISYYPIFLFFKDNPSGYFVSALILYVIMCVVTFFFVWKLTNDKVAAFLSGYIVATGYVGAEMMFMSSVSGSSITYIILSIILILVYKKYIEGKSKKIFLLIAFLLYIFLTLVFAQRAHTLIYFIFLADFYFRTRFNLPFSSLISSFIKSIFRSIPFLLISILPAGQTGSPVYSYIRNFTVNQPVVFFNNLAGFVFPNFNLDVSSLLGVFIFAFLAFYFIFSKVSVQEKRVGFFFFLLWIAAYLNYHLSASDTIQGPTQRYLLFGLPFFAAVISLFIRDIFYTNRARKIQIVGSVFVLMFGLFHVYQVGPLKKEILQRDLVTRRFYNQLSGYIPQLHGRTLFYFDVVSDTPTQVLFSDIMRVGIYETEVSLATFYKVDKDTIKIVNTYSDFIKEKEKGDFRDSYSFFYNIEGNLINVNDLVLKEGIEADKRINLRIGNGQLNYKSEVVNDKEGSRSLSKILKFDTDFSSSKPIVLNMVMKVSDTLFQVRNFPYVDISVERPKYIDINLIHNDSYRRQLFNYIQERNDFRNTVSITASSNGEGREPLNLKDGDIGTSWEVSKAKWVGKEETYIEVKFSQDTQISQVRWVSPHPARVPNTYEYEVQDATTREWKKVFSVESGHFLANKYVVDSFSPVKGKLFRMVIKQTATRDFPGISEIEFLKTDYNVDSILADFLLKYPLFKVEDAKELSDLRLFLKGYMAMEVFPLSDKFLTKNDASRVIFPLYLDGRYHRYKVTIPQGGTKVNGLILNFPNIPIEATISDITLSRN